MAEVADPNDAKSKLRNVLEGASFDGEYAIFEDGEVSVNHTSADGPYLWPWASVTKQVMAVAVMQQVEKGKLDLDAAADKYLPALAGDAQAPTIRQLLQHQSGLRNPDDTPEDATGIPDFYTTGPSGIDFCLKDRTAPSENGWRYNNCDFIVLGAVLESVTGDPCSWA